MSARAGKGSGRAHVGGETACETELLFDLKGQMLAQAVTGTPGHVNSMARSVIHFIREFPVETMKPGDAYITNDPWMGTGHLNDFVITTPCFRNGKLVAAVLVEPSDEIMLISTGGVLIRTSVESIREMGRSTQGVTLINLDDGTFLASVEKVAESEVDESMRVSGELADADDASAPPAVDQGDGGETPAAGEDGDA